MALATLTSIMKFFELTPGRFRPQWDKLTDADKDALRRGIGDGSYTY